MKQLNSLLFFSILTTTLFAQKNTPNTLKLLFVGDIMGHGPQVKSAYDATTQTYNYEPCFKYVKPIIEKADLAVGNLEVTLPGKPPYKGYPMFRSPDALADALKSAGFDMLVTSNNHSNDAGKQGVIHTIDVLHQHGFYHTGTFKNKTERDIYYPLIVYKNGFRLAFLNYTYDTNGLPTIPPTMVNLIDEKLIQKDLAFTQKLKPDMTIVVMHWGLEYQLNESLVQKRLARKIFEWGGDLVIGAHPHVIQPIKKIRYKNTDNQLKEGYVAYSLGNFISNQTKPNTDGGLMVEIELKKKENSRKAYVNNCQYIPVWRYIDKSIPQNRYGVYRSIPISAFENDTKNLLKMPYSDKKQMARFAARMRKHLSRHAGKERKLTLQEIVGQPAVGHTTHTQNPYARLVANYQPSEPNDTTPTFKKILPLDPASIYTEADELQDRQKRQREKANTQKSGKIQINQPPSIPVVQSVVSQNTPAIPPQYRIQFQSSSHLYHASSFPFNNVEIEETGQYFRYFIPAGNSIAEAQKTLELVQNAGFTDAFIVKRGKGLPKDSNKKGGTVPQTTIPSITYKIQFQSSRKLHSSNNIPFDDVHIEEVEGLFKYFVGNTTTWKAAVEMLTSIQSKGFKDAFIVRFKDGRPVIPKKRS